MPVITNLAMGVNLHGVVSGQNMIPGEASDACNWIPRPDLSIMKHWGTIRTDGGGLSGGGVILRIQGFAYNGKNTDAGTADVTTARPGNYPGLAAGDDGAQFTRRKKVHYGALLLTDATAHFWNPVTGDWSSALTLPPGVSLLTGLNSVSPTTIVLQDNVYILGWADKMLRYDPTDQQLYNSGWEDTPTLVSGSITVTAGGTLQANATYKYRAAWVNLYTGEQSGLGNIISRTTTAANRTVTFAAGAFPFFDDNDRHYAKETAGAPTVGEEQNQDVGIVLYRTEANQEVYHFLDLIFPNTLTATRVDNGLSTDATRRADQSPFEDIKAYYAAAVYKNMMYGVFSSGQTIFFNDFTTTKSHFERTQPLNQRALPFTDGEEAIALCPIDEGVLIISNKDGYMMQAFANTQTGRVSQTFTSLHWGVGIVGPQAWDYRDGYLYWMSQRGPYRWRPGMVTPEWIGKNLLPLFEDPFSGGCKMSPLQGRFCEVIYDPDADVMRYLFAVGDATYPNQQVYQWMRFELLPDAFHGWFFGLKTMMAGTYTHAVGSVISPDTNMPESPRERVSRFVFAFNSFETHQYEPSSTSIDGAGFPCYWRSWLDHGGEPSLHKISKHFWVGMSKMFGDAVLDVVVAASQDSPDGPYRELTTNLNSSMQKVITSVTGRWFFWEFANSRADEPVHVTFIKTDLRPMGRPRR